MVMRILIIAAVAIYVVFWVRVVIDLFRRHDLTTIREGRLDDLPADPPLHQPDDLPHGPAAESGRTALTPRLR